MNWRLKALALRLLHATPYGEQLRYLAQLKITRRLPRVLLPTCVAGEARERHLKYLVGLETAVHYEFGAGWDLYSALYLWCHGVDHQELVDLSPLAKMPLVNGVIEALSQDPPARATRKPTHMIQRDLRGELARQYGIVYSAPADARHTSLDAGSIDVVSSTNTLEHIAESDIRLILVELRRITHTDSVLSLIIDYSDHYSHTDRTISPLNYLRYPSSIWRLANPANHYQNRLRHGEYRRLFEEAGFHVVVEDRSRLENAEEVLRRLPIAAEFRHHSMEDLSTVWGHFVLRPRARI